MSVTLTLMPAAIVAVMEGRHGGVEGILIITLGRSTIFQRRAAASIVPCVSFASSGETSRLTNPSKPFVES